MAVEQTSDKKGIRVSRERLRAGCLPISFLLSLILVVAVNLVVFAKIPSWVDDSRRYIMMGRLALAIGMLLAIQLLFMWVTGMVFAQNGSESVRGGGGLLRLRLRLIRRKMLYSVLAIFILRFLMILLLIGGGILTWTEMFGSSAALIPFVEFGRGFIRRPFLIILASVALLIHWLSGPFLRMRYSTALGALAGTWADSKDDRRWAAITARLGVGLLGVLSVLWGVSLSIFLFFSMVEPYSGRTLPYPQLFPRDSLSELYMLALALIVWSMIYPLGQIILGWVYLALAERRLRKKSRGSKTAA